MIFKKELIQEIVNCIKNNHLSHDSIVGLFKTFMIKDVGIIDIVVECIQSPYTLDIDRRRYLIEIIENTKITSSTQEGWIFCSNLVIITGHFDIAYYLKVKAKKFVYVKSRLQIPPS